MQVLCDLLHKTNVTSCVLRNIVKYYSCIQKLTNWRIEMSTIEYKVTSITLTKNIGGNEKAYEATISVNNEFVIQVSGDDEIATFSGIAHPSDKYHEDPEKQQNAFDNLDNDVVERSIEAWGFENNLGWLEDNADVVL